VIVRAPFVLRLLLVLGACGDEAPAPSVEVRAERQAVRRAEVRALLDTIEGDHPPESIPEEDVRALYDERIEGTPFPSRAPFEDLEAELRDELAQRERFRALTELVGDLSDEVEFDRAGVEMLPGLPIRFEDPAP
tara:strand:- start:1659 stop:2063 length:405 start_codon:yes stop_codon:yes gene_type:complete